MNISAMMTVCDVTKKHRVTSKQPQATLTLANVNENHDIDECFAAAEPEF